MATIKQDMRNVSKAAASGDILVRDGSIAKFDYNSGKFTLKPVAQLPEDLFAAVNEAYLAAGKKDFDATVKAMNAADGSYGEWLKELKTAGF